MVVGPPGRRPSERSGMGRGNLPEVRDGSGDTRGGPGQVGGTSLTSGTGRGNLPEVLDRGHSGRSGMGRGTLGEFRDGLGEPY